MHKTIVLAFFWILYSASAGAAIFPSQGLCTETFQYQGEQIEIETLFTYGFLSSFKGVSVTYVFQGEEVTLDENNGLNCVTSENDFTMCTVSDEQNPILKTVGAGFPFGATISLKDGKDYVNFFDSCEEL